MFQPRRMLIIAFIFPILILIGMVGIHSFYLVTSEQRVFPIRGYDPRSLLSGHYLRFLVDYELKCPSFLKKKAKRCPFKAHICLEPEKRIDLFHKPNKDCSLFIKGFCSCNNVFSAREEYRYYVPEQYAKKLEKLLMNTDNKREVVLSITKKGHIMIKDININGKPIKNWIK